MNSENKKERITVTIFKNHRCFKKKIERFTQGGCITTYQYTDDMRKALGEQLKPRLDKS